MRTGPFLALFFAVLVIVAGQLEVTSAAAHDFSVPPGTPDAPLISQPQCFRVALLLDGSGPRQTIVRLTTHLAFPRSHWYHADAFPRAGFGDHAYWRRVGTDSIDLGFPSWPGGKLGRARYSPDHLSGRAEELSDIVGAWGPTGTVQGERVPCPGPIPAVRREHS